VFKVSEVYEKQIKSMKERPDGSEYVNFEKVMTSRDILINLDYVVSVQPYEFTSSLALSKIEKAFPEGTKFSNFVVDGNSFRKSEIIAIGSFDKFSSLLRDNNS
jgi:hypothetical protein|tara:strand:- start:1886 stop:2197 length:312 start_codon:yes stop_codon:yes gene_type:complete